MARADQEQQRGHRDPLTKIYGQALYVSSAEKNYKEPLYVEKKFMGMFYMSPPPGSRRPEQTFGSTNTRSPEHPFPPNARSHWGSGPVTMPVPADPNEQRWDSDGEEPLLDEWSLEVLCNMDNPPGEAYEPSYRRARDLLEAAGASSAILLQDGNLESAVVLSSGEQRIPTNVILGILDTHLGSLIGQEPEESSV